MDQKFCDNLKRICGDGFCYLASPYSKFAGGIVKANDAACRVAAELLLRGVPVFCPIAHSHAVAMTGQINPMNGDFWLKADAPFMRAAKCLVVVCLDGWEESVGILLEIGQFDQMAKPIYYLDWDATEGEK